MLGCPPLSYIRSNASVSVRKVDKFVYRLEIFLRATCRLKGTKCERLLPTTPKVDEKLYFCIIDGYVKTSPTTNRCKTTKIKTLKTTKFTPVSASFLNNSTCPRVVRDLSPHLGFTARQPDWLCWWGNFHSRILNVHKTPYMLCRRVRRDSFKKPTSSSGKKKVSSQARSNVVQLSPFPQCKLAVRGEQNRRPLPLILYSNRHCTCHSNPSLPPTASDVASHF